MKKILSPLFLSLFLSTSAHALCGNNWSHSTLDICADEAETITGAWNFTGPVTFTTVTVNQSILGNVTATGNLSGANVSATYGVSAVTGTFSGALTAGTINGVSLPGDSGTDGFVLSTDGAGTLSWIAQGNPTGVTYMKAGTSPDVSGYKALVTIANYTPAAKATTTIATVLLNQYVSSSTTNSGVPGVTLIPEGVYHGHFHLKAGNASRIKMTMEIYKRTAAGVETDLYDSEESAFISTTETEYDLYAIAKSTVILATDRIVMKLKATTVTGAATDLSIYSEGVGTQETGTRLDMPAFLSNYAPTASPTFTGTVTVNGTIDANASGQIAQFDRVDISSVTTTAGKVGIFTNNPTVALDVAGEVKMAYWDGWLTSTNSWTRLGNSSFTIPGDQLGFFSVGDKIKVSDTTTKFFYVVGVASGTATSTITVHAGSDYVLAASPTAAWWSKSATPQGFPDWFNTTSPTWDVSTFDNGSGGQPTKVFSRYSMKGKTVTAFISFSGTKAGTNSSHVFSPATVFPTINANYYTGCQAVIGAGMNSQNPGIIFIYGATTACILTSATISDNQASANVGGTFTYEVQ